MAAFDRFKDYSKESVIFKHRALIAFFVVLVMLGVLVTRIYYLQVVEYDRYASISEDNRVQLQPVAPRRGLIFDRNGTLLADNRPTFSLNIVKEQAGDLDETINKLKAFVDISDHDIERFQRHLRQRRHPYESVPIVSGLTQQQIAEISVNYYRLPGVSVEADLVRHYPYGEALVPALGYVGRINERELRSVNAENYAGTHYIGKLGVERFYEPQLHGKVGLQKVETNARGRVLRVLEQTDPVPGVNIKLTLDLKLQQFTQTLLKHKRAALVAIDPRTGGILALVSNPSYDPNMFVNGISRKNYQALQQNLDLPLYNRALRGRYPPGSTLKPFVALSAIDSESIKPDFRIFDPGYFQLSRNGRKYRDWKRGGHGWVDLDKAIYESVDTWFYDVGNRTGVDVMSSYLSQFGFGRVTSLDMPEADSALLPTKEWKMGRFKRPWYPGDNLNMAIGQGFMLATPLQLATATMVMANRGKWKQPHLLAGVMNDDGSLTQPELADATPKPRDIKLNHPKFWDNVIKGMTDVMSNPHGTGYRTMKGSDYTSAGKSGTAQVVGIPQEGKYDSEALKERQRDHSLFIAFAPVENPTIALAVVVENGEEGSVRIAKEVLDAWMHDDYENDLPEDMR